MPTIRWLHLTDLHFGDPHVKSLWSDNIEAAFVADLAGRAAERGGPLDLLLFTGDLVFSGSDEQFAAFERWLQRLYAHLDRLGLGNPVLLAVPGNHDLIRPETDAARSLMDGWHTGTLSAKEYPLLANAFAAYKAWWSARSAQLPGLQAGILPGDFATTLDREGYKLGIIGLNSAFLHLTGGNLQGQLMLSEEQLSAVCGGSVNDWISQRHLTLLLTHHPPSWLKNRAQYDSEIAPPGRFAVHLYGHMHTPESGTESRGEGPQRRLLQGASLFGLEHVDGNQVREHGYVLGTLRFGTEQTTLQLTPRRAHKQQGGSWSFSTDSTYSLIGNSTAEATLQLVAPHPIDQVRQDAPGGGYKPESYVPRGRESEVLDFLRVGTPLLLVGPAHIGKSNFIGYIEAKLKTQPFWDGGRIYEIPGSQLAGQDINAVLENFAEELCRIDETLEEGWHEASQRKMTKQKQVDRFFERGVLGQARGPILLLLDNADFIITQQYAADFVSLLRAWIDRSKGVLRIVLTASTSRSYHPIERSAFTDLFQLIELGDFDFAATMTIARKYLPLISDAELVELRRKVSGHPYFVRFYLYHAARRSVSLAQVLQDLDLERQLLNKIAAMLREIPSKVLDEITRCYGSRQAPTSQEMNRWLRFAGLLSDDEKNLRCQLYERFFLHRSGI